MPPVNRGLVGRLHLSEFVMMIMWGFMRNLIAPLWLLLMVAIRGPEKTFAARRPTITGASVGIWFAVLVWALVTFL